MPHRQTIFFDARDCPKCRPRPMGLFVILKTSYFDASFWRSEPELLYDLRHVSNDGSIWGQIRCESGICLGSRKAYFGLHVEGRFGVRNEIAFFINKWPFPDVHLTPTFTLYPLYFGLSLN